MSPHPSPKAEAAKPESYELSLEVASNRLSLEVASNRLFLEVASHRLASRYTGAVKNACRESWYRIETSWIGRF